MVLQFLQHTISHFEEGVAPRLRDELNAIQALGAILNKREWWRKWHDPEIRAKWFSEIDESLVALHVRQVVSVWPYLEHSEGMAVFNQYVEVCNDRTSSIEEKQVQIQQVLTHALYPPDSTDAFAFAEGNRYCSDDEDGSDRCNGTEKRESAIDAELDFQDHMTKNPFGQIAWYTNMVTLCEQLRAVSVERWTQVDEGAFSGYMDVETLEEANDPAARLQPLDEMDEGNLSCGDVINYFSKIAHNEPVLQTAITAILAAVRDESCTLELVKTLFPSESRENVIRLLHLHLQKIRQLLHQTKLDITRVLDLTIEHARLSTAQEQPLIPGRGRPGPAPQTWISDDLIDAEVKAKFVKEVAVLEDVPEELNDWHPNSNNQVLNLVHPSLFCGVNDVTPVLASREVLDTLPATTTAAEHVRKIMFAPTTGTLSVPESTGFQWLPCEVDVGGDSHDCFSCEARVRTYINNLHPEKHASMYDSIGSIFAKFVPLFDQVLSTLESVDVARNDYGSGHDQVALKKKKELEKFQVIYPDATKSLQRLTPPELFEWDQPKFTLQGSRCQVIVKIAEIVLTPDKPEYAGGSWHVEGTDSERIIATGLYYFASDNISESRLSFRVTCRAPDYEQSDHAGVGLAYGLENTAVLMQDLGSVTAIEDRCLVFPNIYQHKVEPFRLADPAKPGVRKILAFFLVDPTDDPVPSTAVVPPQQEEWIERATQPALKRLRLPDVVTQRIQDMTRTGMTLDQAKQYRLDLMEERSPPDYGNDENYVFSLCEH